ncbi:MAG: NAD(P)H-dependent oxidoreductase subunit E [Salinisphaera sp.]|nr:NAD(P)H-dependent oxidoreductase subunit E [Salinisphaera sp.]
MKLLNKMMALQAQHGAVTDDLLRGLAHAEGVPLYRLEGLRGFYPMFKAAPGAGTQVHVCRDMVCRMRGGADYCDRVEAGLAGDPGVEVHRVSCVGRCDHAPAASINEVPVAGDADTIVAYAKGREPLSQWPDPEPRQWPTDPYADHGARYGLLKRMVTAAGDGEAERDQIVQTLKDVNLRGLGGAAFPTGMKWDFTRKAKGETKYVICNADESEPGTFKDRMLLEELPHLIIEAMALGGWVIGASKGIIYIRHEYGPETRALNRAIEAAYAAGALGDDLFGSGFCFHLETFVSPGGYILGEETALLEALEDKRGEPRNKPPFPTNVGLWGQPTLMNNVETFAAIPVILERGAQWWADQGLGDYQGLKYTCVSGDVAKPGVYCIPWGTTVADLLERCGGVPNGRRLQAFSPGGASTNFLPAAKADTAMDFDALAKAGSALGTAAMVYLDETRDLVDLALQQVRFFRNESCGKCVPCRVGSHKAVEMVEQQRNGGAANSHGSDQTAFLKELHQTLAKTSICGLGQVAMAPLVSVIDHFPDDPGVTRLRGATP